jgi:hypothetical protein
MSTAAVRIDRVTPFSMKLRAVAVLATVMTAGGMALAVPSAPAGARTAPTGVEASLPTVTGPVSGGAGQPTLLGTTLDLSRVGYVAAEYFLAGEARAYTPVLPLTADGRWTVRPTTAAHYQTRLVVYRPSDPTRFNGTVVAEWLNVSGGADIPADWIKMHAELIRDGFAWVGISAQAVGIEGPVGGTVLGRAIGGVKAVDPARYSSLTHPGDSYSYDIYTQAALALRRRDGVDPMGGVKVRRVIADGYSQSADRLVTYIDAVQHLAHRFDGFLVHSRSGAAARLSEAPEQDVTVPTPTPIRTDLDVPVLLFETETDVALTGFSAARQPDSARLRLWEVAGTAHLDSYFGIGGSDDTGNGLVERALLDVGSADGGPSRCPQPINRGPQYAVLEAAIYRLDRWIRGGTPPFKAPRLELTTGPFPSIIRDTRGEAIGGIRTPLVDVPTAALQGQGNSGSTNCILSGTTGAFDAATLATLYPTHAQYVSQFDQATTRAVNAGVLLKPEARRLENAASQTRIGAGT